jgi:xeroderma pigmentosum group C-complementing protein
VDWWTQTYFTIETYGHIRNRTFDQVQSQIEGLSHDDLMDGLDALEDVEIIRSSKSLMKHALACRGSRDVSAQLFTALCRALGIPARLVVSLQSVPWQAKIGKPKTPKTNSGGSRRRKTDTGKGKGKAVKPIGQDGDESDEDEDIEPIEIPTPDLKGKGKAIDGLLPGDGQSVDGRVVKQDRSHAASYVKLRKSKDKGQALGSSSFPMPRRQGICSIALYLDI